MTAGSGILHQEMPQGDPQGRMHGFQLWANLPSSLKMTRAALPGHSGDRNSGGHRRRRHACSRDLRDFWGKKGPVDGVAADPLYLDVWVPPGRRKTLPVETTRHAFAYVFEGRGKFCQASQPLGVLTEKAVGGGDTLVRERTGNRSLVLFDSGRRGDRAGWREGHPLSSGLRQAARGARRLVRAHRDEHASRTSAGGRRVAKRNVHQALIALSARFRPSPSLVTE